jgi:hypothetical protein
LFSYYDSLNDTVRRDFIAAMLEAKEVYSKPANGNLLTYALKTNRMDLQTRSLQT